MQAERQPLPRLQPTQQAKGATTTSAALAARYTRSYNRCLFAFFFLSFLSLPWAEWLAPVTRNTSGRGLAASDG